MNAVKISECEEIGQGTAQLLGWALEAEEKAALLAWRAERAMERVNAAERAEGLKKAKAWAWAARAFLDGRMDHLKDQ